MAVLPQMLVPTAISVASRSDRPERLPRYETIRMAAGIVTSTTGSVLRPMLPTSARLSSQAEQHDAEPQDPLHRERRCRRCSASGNLARLPSASPSRIATMMPLMAPVPEAERGGEIVRQEVAEHRERNGEQQAGKDFHGESCSPCRRTRRCGRDHRFQL